MLKTKRAYQPASPDDGRRFLVERLWPRAISKDALRLDGWLKEAAPSTQLRKWFSHDVRKWPEFKKRYRAELKLNPDAWRPIFEAARRGTVTLIYAAHDTEHNSALVLADYLDEHLRGKPGA
jgi:uncharacterized protein YeaO (DUF488 family)